MTRLSNNEPVSYERLSVMYGDKCTEIVQNFESGKVLQFMDVLTEINYRGGVVTLLAESYESGEVFRYGKFNDSYWYKIGELKGFA